MAVIVIACIIAAILCGIAAYRRYRYPNGLQVDYVSPRFDIATQSDAAMKYLHDYGYVVMASVASATEVAAAKDLMWNWLESLPDQGLDRSKPSSWSNWPGIPQIGLIGGSGVGQTAFLWFIRGLPRVRATFEAVWGDRSLLVSFDGCGIFRPWGINQKWKTKGGWFHTDQNAVKRPGRACVQGLVSLYDGNATTGNLVVVPGSHQQFHRLTNLARHNKADFTSIPADHDIYKHCQRPRLVHCRAGDLVLWDSRTVHCNSPALRGWRPPIPRTLSGNVDLLRAVAYVCMTPSSFAVDEPELGVADEEVVGSSSKKDSNATRMGPMSLPLLVKQRQQAVVAHVTTNHWPHMYFEGNRPPLRPNQLKLTDEQLRLVTGEAPPTTA